MTPLTALVHLNHINYSYYSKTNEHQPFVSVIYLICRENEQILRM